MSIAPLSDVAHPYSTLPQGFWIGYTKSSSSCHIASGSVESVPFLVIIIETEVLGRHIL